MNGPVTWDSAYPGSMYEREDGQYVDRNDSKSLAYALLEMIDDQKREIEDLHDQIASEGWRPIGTAPKQRDVLIDLWCSDVGGDGKPTGGGERYTDCWWHTFENGTGDWATEIKPNGDVMCLVNATHWRPQPLPPK